jgi:hypothetical protein
VLRVEHGGGRFGRVVVVVVMVMAMVMLEGRCLMISSCVQGNLGYQRSLTSRTTLPGALNRDGPCTEEDRRTGET